VTGGGRRGAMSGSRRGRFDHHEDGVATVPVVDQADCAARSCRSCVAVTLADAIALGCCPCAVVSLLGLAFVKAPLAVARRFRRRLRRRQGELRHRKRVRDEDMDTAAWKGEVAGMDAGRGSSSRKLDAEKVWMEMYGLGQWGFGRLSVSVVTPVRASGHVSTTRSPDGGRRRKDADLRCES
jgi:hypothetical protein